MSDSPRVKAAQYLRMSTEHQRYSLQNQNDAIAPYAEAHGYEVNRTYFDPGKSGLTLSQRRGLQALLADALDPKRGFDAVLVLDVSRWGRFQDMDQSAHYEFLCREAGLKIVYCAEPFANDGTAASAIVKQIKRIMAAEFSRELSEKVRFARRKRVELGYYPGGSLPYGFRRMAVDSAGHPRAILKPGHWKSVATDHVIVAPGPVEERNVIRWIFKQYVIGKQSARSIAIRLNEKGIPNGLNIPWSQRQVCHVLNNELVIGNYVLSKTYTYLRSPKRVTSPDKWVRVKVLKPIVSTKTFRLAKDRLARSRPRLDDEEILRGLRRLFRENGYLSRYIINKCPYLPSANSVRIHFGGVARAYVKAGYDVGTLGKNDRLDDGIMLARLKRLHAELGYVSSSVIEADETLPHSNCFKKHFGSLIRAYELAGLPHNKPELLRQAQRRSVERRTTRWTRRPLSDEEMLVGLRQLFDREGYVSRTVVDADPDLPTYDTYRRRFGSWPRAIEFAGLPMHGGHSGRSPRGRGRRLAVTG